MQLNNTSVQYGSLTKILHWVIAILVIIQFYLGLWAAWILPPNSPKLGLYIGKLHEPIGILFFGILVITVLWILRNPHPLYPDSMPLWEKITARINHILLYITLLAMPITGIVTAMANGYSPNFFGLYQFPALIEKTRI